MEADYRDRSRILRLIGAVALLAGVGLGFLGPLETNVFYFFTEGGRFYYDGFGFGSFMFGNIAAQILGYYLMAVFLIPLGYGHLRLRRWARPLALTLLWFWLIVGIPIIVAALFVIVSNKDLTSIGVLLAVILLALSYLVFPGLFIRFYRSKEVRLTFEAREPKPSWLEGLPLPVAVLCLLFLFYAAALHILLLFRGIFPLFGTWLVEMAGIVLVDLSVLGLVILIWGTLRLKAWAWWGALVYFGLMTISVFLSFMHSSYADLLARMRFPPTEMEALQGLPLQGWHAALLFGVPLLATTVLIVYSRRCFVDSG